MKKQPPKYTGAWYRHMALKIETVRAEIHYTRLKVDQDYRRRYLLAMMIPLGTPIGFLEIRRLKKINHLKTSN